MIETYKSMIQNLGIQFDLELVKKENLVFSDVIETEMARLSYEVALINKLVSEVDSMSSLTDEEWKQVHNNTAVITTSCLFMSINFIEWIRKNKDFEKVRKLPIENMQKQIMEVVTNLISIGLEADISMSGNVNGGTERH